MVTAALFTSSLPLIFAASILSALAAWLIRLPQLAVVFLLVSLLAGQTLRGPLPGQGGGVLLSDLAVAIVLCSTLVQLIFKKRRSNYSLLLITLPFIAWSLFTLILNPLSLPTSNWLVAFAYWARLSSYLLLLPALLWLVCSRRVLLLLKTGLPLIVVLLCSAGIIQLLLLPNLSVLGRAWDPHEGRLVSTWLDPNFFGAFLAVTLPYLVAQCWYAARLRVLHLAALILGAIALPLTQSRSSLIALTVAVLILSPLLIVHLLHIGQSGDERKRRTVVSARLVALVTVVLIGIALLGLGVLLLGDRAVGLVAYDPNVQLRAAALAKAWDIAAVHSVAGVGYNAYQFAALREGLIGNFSIHSRAGADNSLLTLWATTGIAGLVLFALPWLMGILAVVRTAPSHPTVVALLVSLLAWVIHAQFVNSLLYGHLIITAAVLIALTISEEGVLGPRLDSRH